MSAKKNNLISDFGIICKQVVVDSASRKWSFINVSDEFVFGDAPDESDFSKDNPALIPLSFGMVFRWQWAKICEERFPPPEKATVQFKDPQGFVIVEEKGIPFIRKIQRPDHFTGMIEVRNFPVSGWGRYEISAIPDGYEQSGNSVFLLIGRQKALKKENATRKKTSKASKKTKRKAKKKVR